MDRLYCTVKELIDDLLPNTGGNEAALLDAIQFASDFIDQDLGAFIPYTATKRFDGNGRDILFVPPLLAVTSITDDASTYQTTDYLLYPRSKHWEDGPYSWIAHDPDGNYSEWTQEMDVISIAGSWGKYSKTLVTGATVQNNPLLVGGIDLIVADGSKLAPGMVLLIESEQALVTATGAVTAAATTVTEPVALTDDTITLASATLVMVGETIRIDLEKMLILDINATTKVAYVARGWNGTKRTTHADNAVVDVYRTFTIKRGVNGTTAAQHLLNVAINRYIPPAPIARLCRMIAGLWKRLADSQYAGRTANVELGQVFYNDAFPKRELEELRAMYNYEVNV
jgi:hypothetical protein